MKDCPCRYDVEGDIVNALQRHGEWMRAGNRVGMGSRSSLMRLDAFNPTRIHLRSNNSSERTRLKGISLFKTSSKGAETSSTRSDVADWRAKPKESISLSMNELQQCVAT